MGNRLELLYELDKLFEVCKGCPAAGGRTDLKACKTCDTYEQIRNIGKKIEEKEKKINVKKISVSEYIEMRYRNLKSGIEIAEYFDMTISKLNNWIKKHRTEVDKEYKVQFGPLTKAELVIATKNRISESVAMNRITNKFYDRQKAITQTTEKEAKDTAWKELAHLAKQNKIPYNTYIYRIKNGTPHIEAATKAAYKRNKKAN
ncbi:hypothetical protein [Niallia sp. RD1]|uniref:hypothetical protein n=1 Tax=Niallia sp. RD1 TaxID=2962858 RepID=UPI0020C19968|nr:hypothetical protein [Niallia sp. RD1]UTI41094.1 hypothetical protein NKG37_19860 [Niallia sp. RD1]